MKRGIPDLPDWAARIQPLGMAGAAVVLGICRRTLIEVLKRYQHFEYRGNKKVFYPEHIEALRREMKKCLDSASSGVTESSTPIGTVAGERVRKSLGTRDPKLAEELRAQYEAKLWKRRSYGEESVRTFEEAVMSYIEAGGERTYLEPLLRRFRGRVLGHDQAGGDPAGGSFSWARTRRARPATGRSLFRPAPSSITQPKPGGARRSA